MLVGGRKETVPEMLLTPVVRLGPAVISMSRSFSDTRLNVCLVQLTRKLWTAVLQRGIGVLRGLERTRHSQITPQTRQILLTA